MFIVVNRFSPDKSAQKLFKINFDQKRLPFLLYHFDGDLTLNKGKVLYTLQHRYNFKDGFLDSAPSLRVFCCFLREKGESLPRVELQQFSTVTNGTKKKVSHLG